MIDFPPPQTDEAQMDAYRLMENQLIDRGLNPQEVSAVTIDRHGLWAHESMPTLDGDHYDPGGQSWDLDLSKTSNTPRICWIRGDHTFKFRHGVNYAASELWAVLESAKGAQKLLEYAGRQLYASALIGELDALVQRLRMENPIEAK